MVVQEFFHKEEILPFVTTWMGRRGITLSEISQKKKDKHFTTSLICGTLKRKITKLIDTENRLMVAQRWGCRAGEMGEGGQKVQSSSYKSRTSAWSLLPALRSQFASTESWLGSRP